MTWSIKLLKIKGIDIKSTSDLYSDPYLGGLPLEPQHGRRSARRYLWDCGNPFVVLERNIA